MPMLSGLANALGLGFQGYGQDQTSILQRQRQKTADDQSAQRLAMDRDVHGVQMANTQSEIASRDAAATRDARYASTIGSPEFQSTYRRALSGDQDAAASVAQSIAGHPNASALLAPLTKPAPRDPVKDYAANRDYAVAHPLPTKPESPTIQILPGADGKPAQGVITHGGELGKTIAIPDVDKSKTGSAEGSMNAVRLKTATEQASRAHDEMTKFEDQILAKQKTISSTSAAAAKIMMSGSPVQAVAAETWLNTHDPEIARYARNQKTVATAERLISPRGGSNAMMNAEAILSGAGAHPDSALVANARNYRSSLIAGLKGHAPPPALQTAPGASGDPEFDALMARAKKRATP